MNQVVRGSKQQLLQLRSEVIDGMQQAEQHLLRAATALYKIREGKLWLLDEDYLAFGGHQTWNDYIRWLSKECDFKRTKLLEWVSALRVLEGLGISPDEVLESEMDLAPIVRLKREVIDYNWKTGEVVGVKGNPSLPQEDLEAGVREVVIELHNLPSTEERMSYIDDITQNGGDDEAITYFVEGPIPMGRAATWHAGWKEGGLSFYFGKDVVPSYVIEDLKSRGVKFIVRAKE